MRVRIVGPPVVDLATTGRDATQDFHLVPTPVIQEIELSRAPGISPEDRGNERTTITFRRARQHASYDAAETFLLTHPAEIRGTVVVEVVTDSGATTYTLSPATVVITDSFHLGVQTVHAYQIVGGVVQT